MEETINNEEKSRAEVYLDPDTKKFKDGNPGGGRPKGSISIKDKVRQYLEDHPEDVEQIVEHFVKTNRELMWQMLEGRPSQDVTSDGKPFPSPIYGGISEKVDE